jgi:hypothetical protein
MEVIASGPDVAECAVLGVKDEIKGEQPCGFLVLKSGVSRPPEEIETEVVKLVRDKIGPVAAFKTALRRRPLAEDPLGQDPERHDEDDRRPRPLRDAGHDRGRRRRRRSPRRSRRGLVRAPSFLPAGHTKKGPPGGGPIALHERVFRRSLARLSARDAPRSRDRRSQGPASPKSTAPGRPTPRR